MPCVNVLHNAVDCPTAGLPRAEWCGVCAGPEWYDDTTYMDEGGVACDIPDGILWAYPAENLAAHTWEYAIELGHMTGGTRLDPPEWMTDVLIESVPCWSKADAMFRALRHYDRLRIIEDVHNLEYDEWIDRQLREEEAALLEERVREDNDLVAGHLSPGEMIAEHTGRIELR